MIDAIGTVVRLLGCGVLAFSLVGCRAAPASSDAAAPCLRHVVLFKFNPGTSAADVTAIETAFRALPQQIPTIVGFEWGTDVSPENLARGYTHCFLVTFADVAGRDAYLPHPAHRAFVDLVRPHLAEAFVVDYVARR